MEYDDVASRPASRAARGTTIRIGPSYELRISRASARAISIGRNNISLWDLNTRKRLIRSHPLSHPSHVNWSRDDCSPVLKSTSGELLVLAAETLEVIGRLQPKNVGEGCEPIFAPCGKRVLDGNWDGLLSLYHIDSGSRLFEHHFPNCMITALVSSPNFEYAAFVVQPKEAAGLGPGPNHTIYIAAWQERGITLRQLPGKWPKLDALAFDDSERFLALLRHQESDYPKGCVEILDLADSNNRRSRDCMLGSCGSSITWGGACRVIATVGEGRYHFYDAKSLDEIGQEHLPYASHVEFSRDGKWIALGAWSGGLIRSTVSSCYRRPG